METKELWAIPHPAQQYFILCNSFEECMVHWFEGYNLPRLIIGSELESFEASNSRVREYFKKRYEANKANSEPVKNQVACGVLNDYLREG